MNAHVPSRRLEALISSGDALDVRQFRVTEAISGFFEVTFVAMCLSPDIDFEANVGLEASFTAHAGAAASRTWTGVCRRIRMLAAEEQGLCTYEVTLVPRLWLLTQSSGHRVFQQMSEVDIAVAVLARRGISPELALSSARKKRKYRVQYGETDHHFFCRMLEDAGVSFHFKDDGTLVLTDAPQASAPRPPLPFRDHPTTADREHATEIELERNVAPGKVTLRDHDYRKPSSYALLSAASAGTGVESQLESYHYQPGAFLFESDRGERTPVADDKGQYRTDEGQAALLADRRLHARRAGAKVLSFKTNAIDVAPGSVVSFTDHPRAEIGGGKPYLVTHVQIDGAHDGKWTQACRAVTAETPYHPELVTARPTVNGVESATVVGPPGEEIHVDEFGRVRVHFHWDRDGKMDDGASCWIHVSQPWGGAGYGAINLPRVGQEVLVDFLGGDPDRPVVIGRVFTNLQRVPYKLPESKSQSGWRSQSTRGKDGYNEILFEDAAGTELLRVQAERDLAKLVKHDESVTIGNDRTKEVKRDDRHTVGRDRTATVLHDETASVANDRSRLVGNDESVVIGNNHSHTVANNETRFVGNNRSAEVAENEALRVGNDRTEQVGGSETRTVGANETLGVAGERVRHVGAGEVVTIGAASARTVGADDHLTVGGQRKVVVKESESHSVGGSRTTEVAENDHFSVAQLATRTFGVALMETVGATKKVSIGLSRATQIGKIDHTTVGESFSISVSPPSEGDPPCPTGFMLQVDEVHLWTKGNAAEIIMKEGKITLNAAEITLNGKTFTKVVSDGTAELRSTKGDVVIQGGPVVKINTEKKEKK